MRILLKSRTLFVPVDCDPKKVYEFVSNPENLPKWAKAFCLSIKKLNGEWIAETLQGSVKFRFAEKNDFGVLDHYVRLSSDVEVYVPMRVIPNGEGSEVAFTLFRPMDMSEDEYAENIKWVEQDLKTLKDVLEKNS